MIVNRRIFVLTGLSGLLTWGRVLALPARLDEPTPVDWATRVFTATARGSGIESIRTSVMQYPSVEIAAMRPQAGLSWHTSPEMGGTYREVSVVDVERFSLPDEAGYLALWTDVEGADAVETRFAGGFFYRDVLTWEIVATGSDDDEMLALVESLAHDLRARADSATPVVAEPATSGLWHLLPTADDLPGDFKQLIDVDGRDPLFTPEGTPDPAP